MAERLASPAEAIHGITEYIVGFTTTNDCTRNWDICHRPVYRTSDSLEITYRGTWDVDRGGHHSVNVGVI